jgi:hypothetical protein
VRAAGAGAAVIGAGVAPVVVAEPVVPGAAGVVVVAPVSGAGVVGAGVAGMPVVVPASGAVASGIVVVPEPVVPVVGSLGGVFGSGVVVLGDAGSWAGFCVDVVAGGVVCCGVCWATAVPPTAASAAANAISFIKASPELLRGAICALVKLTQE